MALPSNSRSEPEKEKGRVLSTRTNLYDLFVKNVDNNSIQNTKLEFDTCIGLVEGRGLIQRLSFGDLVLLQPEWLDSYASSIVNAARSEPDGLGQIGLDEIRNADFRMPQSERLEDRHSESLLLIATIEELLRREIALREATSDGTFLVFPTELTRERPDYPDPPRKATLIEFQGAVLNIYATLVVRLSHSGVFRRLQMWKSAATFRAGSRAECGFLFRLLEEGRAQLILFFGPDASMEARVQFEGYILAHLERRVVPGTLIVTPIVTCQSCGFVVTDQLFRLRTERGFDWLDCPVCQSRVSLALRERLPEMESELVNRMDVAADAGRDLAAAAATLAGKIATKDYDAFFAYNTVDQKIVSQFCDALKRRGIYPWMDVEQILPGRPFQSEIQKAIARGKSAVVFVGKKGIGKWESLELRSLITQFVKHGRPVIPVLLPGVTKVPRKWLFLTEFNSIKVPDQPLARNLDARSIDELIAGISGKRNA